MPKQKITNELQSHVATVVGSDIAKLEGEDSDLESWQKNHKAFWLEEGSVLGYIFSEDMPFYRY